MKKILLVIPGIILTFSRFGQAPTLATEISNRLEQTTQEQNQLIVETALTFPERTQLSIAMVENNKVTFTGIERYNDTLNFTDNSLKIFEIGSISKVFTSTLLANLIQNHKVGLSDQMNSCINIPLCSCDTFTLQQLANHTSGLPRLPANLNLATVDFRNPYKNYSEEDLLEYLSNDTTVRNPPGEKYEYSNLGAGLLAYLLEKKEGSDYETLLRKYIFEKYGMSHSTTLKKDINEELVSGLDAGGNETPNWYFNVLVGAGGILSNVSDLTKFAQAQFDPTDAVLKLTRESTFKVNDGMEIGLGWHILHPEPGKTWYWHNGGTGGYTSSFAIDVENKTAVVILSNVSAFNPNRQKIDDLCFGLIKTLK